MSNLLRGLKIKCFGNIHRAGIGKSTYFFIFIFVKMTPTTLNLLLADDDSDDCQFFKIALGELLFPTQLSLVHDGEQLMELLSNDKINLPCISATQSDKERHTSNRPRSVFTLLCNYNGMYTYLMLGFQSYKKCNSVGLNFPLNFPLLIQVINHLAISFAQLFMAPAGAIASILR